MGKAKKIFKVIIILFYILLLGDMILNYGKYNFNEEWLFLVNIILLGIGLYSFVQLHENK